MCHISPVGLAQLNVATRPTTGLKKLGASCCGSWILNYVFMDLHNSLSDGVLLFRARAGNCGRGDWAACGETGMEKRMEGERRGKLKT